MRHSEHLPISHREHWLRIATYAALTVAIVLVSVKLIAWVWTGSVSILATLVDSLIDCLASLINLLAVRYSLTPPDSQHRYGHGKAEPLAGLLQAVLIVVSAMFIASQAVQRLRVPVVVEELDVGLAVMVFATLLTSALVVLQRKVINYTQSTAIRADSLHYITDLVTNLSIILALALSFYGIPHADPIIAICIAVFIFYNGAAIGYESFQLLIDREISSDEQHAISALALAHPDVLGVHDLRTRRSGQRLFIQIHIELDETLPLSRAHKIGDEVEQEIIQAFPEAEVITHHDPVLGPG